MATFRVHPAGPVACFIVRRSDGQELSLSSEGNSLVRFVGEGREIVKDYGRVYSTDEFLAIVADFVAEENDLPASVYARREHRSA